MTEIEQKIIFRKNLNRLVEQSEKTQKEIADAIKVSPQTFNTWMTGKAIPRMGKIQALADYFGISKSDLVDEKTEEGYYTDPKTAQIAERIYQDQYMGMVFDALDNSSPEEIKDFYDMLMLMKRRERHED